MANEITKIFDSLTDDDIQQGIEEIIELERTGFIHPNSHMIQELCRKIKPYTMSAGMDLMMVTHSIQRQAALRWLSDRKSIIIETTLKHEGNGSNKLQTQKRSARSIPGSPNG